MEDPSVFLLSAIAVFTCLTLATLIHAIAERTRISFTVALLFGGIILSFITQNFEQTIFEHFSFSPEIVFYVFLPTLIFESAYHLNFRQFRGVVGEVSLLATLGLILSVSIISSSLHFLIEIPWGASVLFAAFISATDPIAVLAVFKELRAPKKLTTIVDGESLLNDGTSLVLFQFILKAVVVTGAIALTPKMLMTQSGHFLLSLFEGIAVGTILGWIFSHAIAKSGTKGVQLTLSLILAHVTFIFSEAILHVSGILATMAAGIIMGNAGRRKLEPKMKMLFTEVWEFMGFIANSLIFLLLGMKLGQVDFAEHWVSMLVAAGVCILLARPFSVYVTFFISNFFRSKENKISFPYQTITAWGGLRGALAAAAVLLIPEDFAFAQQLQAMTAGVIVGTFVLNATTISTLLKKMKLVDFTVSERIQEYEVQILIDEAIKKQLKSLLYKKYITQSVFEHLENIYSSAEEKTILDLEGFEKTLKKRIRETEKFLTYHALGTEMQSYRKLFDQHELSEKRFMVLMESMERQTERLDRDILPDERQEQPKIAPEIPHHCPFSEETFFGIPQKIYLKYRDHRIIERLQHYRGRRISSWKLIRSFRDLKEKHPLLRNSKVLEKIIRRYEKWHANAEKKMEKLESRFPHLVMGAKIHMAERVCLRLEKTLIKKFLDANLVSEKVYKKMDENLAERTERNLVWLRKHYL